jgi:hypothetical protein
MVEKSGEEEMGENGEKKQAMQSRLYKPSTKREC